jgi:uncharacterized protein
MIRDELIGRGIAFPFRVSATGGIETSGGARRVQDALWIILSTSLGERVMRPEFGASVHDYVFDTNVPVTWEDLADAIRQAVVRWEPRVDLLNVRVDAAPPPEAPESPAGAGDPRVRRTAGRSRAYAVIDYRVRDTNEVFNMVYPLYAEEGLR